jgi:cob(I)alamin adenosyltransferase
MKKAPGTGDRGTTSLFSGERVPKDHLQVEAYGAVDELNACLGALIASLPPGHPDLAQEIRHVQSDLFQVGAWLATTPESPLADNLAPITGDPVERLELAMGRMEKDLPPLTSFVLPGGHPAAAWAHVARTVCRRAERRVVPLLDPAGAGKVEQQLRQALVYLNRLSDYLFALARHCNRLAGVADVTWKKG